MKRQWHMITIVIAPVFWFLFFLFFLIFDVLYRLTYWLFGYAGLHRAVTYSNLSLMFLVRCIGVRYKKEGLDELPDNEPIIVVANHQSMFDLPPFFWYLRRKHPKFISKKEIGKGIPGVSFNLRKGGHVLIDRKNRDEALQQIHLMADYMKDKKRAVVIFPEGTRSNSARPLAWRPGGLTTLLERLPQVAVLPVSISNSWKVMMYNGYYFPFGTIITLRFHPVMRQGELPTTDFITSIRNQIEDHLPAS